jgi:hypothetical protein
MIVLIKNTYTIIFEIAILLNKSLLQFSNANLCILIAIIQFWLFFTAIMQLLLTFFSAIISEP